jgi:hypothetical protein
VLWECSLCLFSRISDNKLTLRGSAIEEMKEKEASKQDTMATKAAA